VPILCRGRVERKILIGKLVLFNTHTAVTWLDQQIILGNLTNSELRMLLSISEVRLSLIDLQIAPALSDGETLKEVVSCLTEYIPISTQGNCDQQTIFEIIVRAASQRDSLENTSKTLKTAPTGNDIRYHLEKYDNLETLESQLNQALQSRLPSRIYQGQQKVAIDLNLIPYYGNPSPQELPYIYRSQAKNGSRELT